MSYRYMTPQRLWDLLEQKGGQLSVDGPSITYTLDGISNHYVVEGDKIFACTDNGPSPVIDPDTVDFSRAERLIQTGRFVSIAGQDTRIETSHGGFVESTAIAKPGQIIMSTPIEVPEGTKGAILFENGRFYVPNPDDTYPPGWTYADIQPDGRFPRDIVHLSGSTAEHPTFFIAYDRAEVPFLPPINHPFSVIAPNGLVRHYPVGSRIRTAADGNGIAAVNGSNFGNLWGVTAQVAEFLAPAPKPADPAND